MPILAAGLAMSRAAELARFHLLSCALGARLFPPSKWAGLFPSAAYRRSASAQLAWGIRRPCRLGCFDAVGGFCGVDEWAAFPFSSWRGAGLPLACRNTSKWLGYFCNAKGQHGFRATLACIASHEARRRRAVCTRQPAGSRTKPASREACRRAAVALRPSCMSPEHPRAQRARCGVKGGERKRVPSGHNRRRRLATGSRQPKRGFDTVVSKTTIEVAGHYPLRGLVRPSKRATMRKPARL